jgi:hypothetical protein
MTITVNSLIRAGAMAQKQFEMREDFEIRVFPSDAPETVRVWNSPRAAAIVDSKDPSPFMLPPAYTDVKLEVFGTRYNNDTIRMGYTRRLNILCLSLE